MPDLSQAELQSLVQEGLALHRQGRLAEAQDVYRRILATAPAHFDALNLLGTLALQARDFTAAEDLIGRALAINPNVAAAHLNRGMALLELKRPTEALLSYDRALALDPNRPEMHFDRANALRALQRFAEALAAYDRAIALKPQAAEAHNNRGNALLELKRPEDALMSYEQALALNPAYAEAHNNRGNALRELKRLEEALASYDQALALNPGYGGAHNNRGTTLLGLKRPHEAIACYDRALELDPNQAEVHYNRGNALRELHRLEEALASYDRAIALRPDYAMAYNNRGNVLPGLKRLDEALASYDKALALKPDAPDAYNNRGNALMGLQRPDAALASFDQALALNPEFADAYSNRGHTLMDLRRVDEALASYEKALAIDPDHPFLFGTALHTRMKLCDWTGLPERLDRLRADIRAGKEASVPLPMLALLDEPSLHRQATKRYVDTKFPQAPSLGAPAQAPRRERIRLGYFSGDFCNHPVAHLIVDLLEAHDRTTFEVFAFSFGPHAPDDVQRRVIAAVDTFVDVRDKSDLAIVRAAREFGIDIAIDLTGHTQFGRTGIFAERCAPVQIHHLGYLGTMGADFIDYIVADETVIPSDRHGDFIEKVITLPHSHQVNATTRKMADLAFTRRDVGLPDTGFVFCCFNNSYKICPPTFDRWMSILKAVDGSVLWLVEDTATTSRNLRKEAQARGVDPSRLVFAPRVPMEQYLARQKLADLFLDTLPYNAGTTASDALWAGLPVLTCPGVSFASRVAASLLKALDLPDLITTSGEAYEARAVELAQDAPQLAAIRRRLADNRGSKPLFDVRLFARHIEDAYSAIHERHHAGLPPASIRIDR